MQERSNTVCPSAASCPAVGAGGDVGVVGLTVSIAVGTAVGGGTGVVVGDGLAQAATTISKASATTIIGVRCFKGGVFVELLNEFEEV